MDSHSPVLELVATLTLALVLFMDALDLESGSRRDWMVPALSRSQDEREPVQIPGIVRVVPDAVREWAADQLRNQPYVLYCT